MNSESSLVGQELKNARENISLTVSDIMTILKIKPAVIQMIELDDYPEQKIDIFLKGHIVAYSKLLKINPQTIINRLEAKGYDFIDSKQKTPAETKVKKSINRKPFYVLTGLFLFYLLLNNKPVAQPTSRTITPPMVQETYYE